jgi:hypothetical protein
MMRGPPMALCESDHQQAIVAISRCWARENIDTSDAPKR